MSCRQAQGGSLEIVSRAKARDREAFEMLVEQHPAATFRLTSTIVPLDASDDAAGIDYRRGGVTRRTGGVLLSPEVPPRISQLA